MLKRIALACASVVLVMAPTSVNSAQSCSAMDECKNECYFRCISFGGSHGYCLDVECAAVTCVK